MDDRTSTLEYEIVWGGDGPEEVLITTSGAASVEGLEAYLRAVIVDPRFHDRIRAIVDHRRLDWTTMTHEQIRRRATNLTRSSRGAGSRVAIVLERAVDYGLVRMELSYAQAWQCDVQAFYSIDEARAWLARDQGDEEDGDED